MKKQMCTADATQQVIKVHLFRANGDNERRKHGGQDGEHDIYHPERRLRNTQYLDQMYPAVGVAK